MKISQTLTAVTREIVAFAEAQNVAMLKDALAAKDLDPELGTFAHTTITFTNTRARARHGLEARVETEWIPPGSAT